MEQGQGLAGGDPGEIAEDPSAPQGTCINFSHHWSSPHPRPPRPALLTQSSLLKHHLLTSPQVLPEHLLRWALGM